MVGTQALQLISRRPWAIGTTAGLATIVLLGIPTGVIDNPWFVRKVPVRGFEIVVLASLTVITGLFAATYARPTTTDRRLRRTGIASGALSWFAISCPLCNPLVVALLGTSGATGAFARVQPVLGVIAITLASTALALRLRSIRHGTCRIAPVENPHSKSGNRAETACATLAPTQQLEASTHGDGDVARA